MDQTVTAGPRKKRIGGWRTFLFGVLCLTALGSPLGVLVVLAPTLKAEVVAALADGAGGHHD